MAIFSNLSAPQTTMSPREKVSAHAQLWKGWANPQPASRQSPGRPREGSGTRQVNMGQVAFLFLQPRLNRGSRKPQKHLWTCSPSPPQPPAPKVTAKVEAKKGKKHTHTKLRFGLKSSLSFLIFLKTVNYVIYDWSLADESA